MYDEFKYLKMEITLKALENTRLPDYYGSMLRGVIGQSLRKISCVKDRSLECNDCDFIDSCPYTSTFYSIDKSKENFMSKVDKAPNPFVIYSVGTEKNNYQKGDEFKFCITIFGEALSYLHHYLFAITEIERLGMGSNRAKFKLIDIKNCDNGNIIALGNEIYYENLIPTKLKDDNEVISKKITLQFDTPLRIQENGKFVDNIPFELLMKNILRRIKIAFSYYFNSNIEIDYTRLIEESKEIKISKVNLKWKQLNRYSSRAKRKMSIGGIIGNISFEGDFEKFYPYLKLAQILHIGKNSTMGLGHFNLLQQK